MAKYHYSPMNFFRQAPGPSIKRYLTENGLPGQLDTGAVEDADPDSIYAAWSRLPDPERARAEKDFRQIDLVADESGITTILEEARLRGKDLEPDFGKMESFYEKAFFTFFEYPEAFENAVRFREADELPRIYWRDRDGIPPCEPRDDKAACDDLADLLRIYFKQKQARGYSCTVELLRRGPAYYYFAYPEDYSRVSLEYQDHDDHLHRRHYRPAFEVVFVYNPDIGRLSTYIHDRAPVAREIQTLFARHIMFINIPAMDKDPRTYNLDPLKDRDFIFKYGETSGITDVRVKLLRFALVGRGSKRITIEADPTWSRYALYDLLDDNKLPLPLLNVTRVGLKATFVPDGRRNRPTRTFYVTFPNSCTLDHDGKDAVLRQMLVDSGIELGLSKEENRV